MMRVIATALLCVLWSVGMSHGQSTTIRISKGYIQGFSQGQTIKFLGIPYATAQRYQYPTADVPDWTAVRNATKPGAMCYQQCDTVEQSLYCNNNQSEDCLTLNVFRPMHNPPQGTSFPVIVYIHGGDFSTGSGSAPVYDADYFASRGHLIVVTFNYRLGAFGFLSIFDKYGDAAGNFGFLDQQAALTWVKVNIASFDGDPERITLIGDGAGCLSAVSHLASPVSQVLFKSAVLHSCPWTVPFRTKAQARSQAAVFARQLGCDVNDVACYRAKSPDEILNAQVAVKSDSYSNNGLVSFYAWGPSIDHREVFYNPYDVFKDTSRFDSKPIVLGVTADEGVGFVYRKFPMPLSRGYYDNFVASSAVLSNGQTLSGITASLTSHGGNVDMREALVRYMNDHVFTCPAIFVAKQVERKHFQRSGNDRPATTRRLNINSPGFPRSSSRSPSSSAAAKVWVFEFTMPTSLPGSFTVQQQQMTNALWSSRFSGSNFCDKRSCHGSDIRALFYSNALPLIERLKTEELGKQMVRYWSNFARYGNVNGIIGSRAHLRTLQIQSALVTDSANRGLNLNTRQQRSQTISFPLGGLNNRQLASPARLTLQSALASFTYWPEYSTQGSEPLTTMLLQQPPVELRRNYWSQRCGGGQQSRPRSRWG